MIVLCVRESERERQISISFFSSQRCIESQTAYARIMQSSSSTTTTSLSAGGLDGYPSWGRKRIWKDGRMEEELFPADGMGIGRALAGRRGRKIFFLNDDELPSDLWNWLIDLSDLTLVVSGGHEKKLKTGF